jgi:spore coat polysaccharide biosynthesis predicted glycosyltransferase SpsG
MAWADIAVSAGGSTCWEMTFMGVPLAIISLAENQKPIAEGLDWYGAGLNLGRHLSINDADIAKLLRLLICDRRRRAQMSQYGQHLVDGHGSARVATKLMES